MYGYVNIDYTFRITSLYTAFKQTVPNDYYFEGEAHNFWEFVMVTDGELGTTAGSDVFILKKGQAIIHEPMEFHRLWKEGTTDTNIIIFSFSAIGMPKYSSKIFEVADLKKVSDILSDFKNCFAYSDLINITGIKNENEVGYQIALKKLEIFILDTVSKKIERDGGKKSQSAKNYSKIVNIMESNIEKSLSVREIAALCNISEINLKKTFSRYSGIGVISYFNKLKINAAISMIKNGMTVQETANALGFSNQNYFSTVFKRITGHSPTFYKNS